MKEREYSKGRVRSADGTTIGYRRCGRGPGLILLHGAMLAAQHFMGLAAALSADFTVYVPDRRGRGLSGPHGDDFSVMREVEDLRALVTATGATRVFGLSSGALVTLRTALTTPALDRIALYEPPLSIDDSVPMGWLARYDRQIAAGKIGSALVTALKGLDAEPVLGRVPRFVLVPLMAIGMRVRGDLPEDDVPIKALVPTQHFDMRIVRDMATRSRTMRRSTRGSCCSVARRARRTSTARWTSWPPRSRTRDVSRSRAWGTRARTIIRRSWGRLCVSSSAHPDGSWRTVLWPLPI
ncbi:MAG TPA: alpha/beta hydrolase [Nonomuraea sp.]|nr:alpha/beta hydrolase [Nonomuraea sp.]